MSSSNFIKLKTDVLNARIQWNEFYHRNTQGVLDVHFNHICLFTLQGIGVSR